MSTPMFPRPRRRAAALVVFLALSLAAGLIGAAPPAARAAPAAPGDLDAAFAGWAGDGVANPTGFHRVDDFAVQPDGKVVIVGYTGMHYQLAVARYLPDGTPDETFGTNGRTAVVNMFEAESVALQGDGRIVVGGSSDGEFLLARLTPTGGLDDSFGGGQGWLSDADPQLRNLKAILVQPDGKIVACGEAFFGGEDIDFAVTRYIAGGARDPDFGGGDGKVTVPFGAQDSCHDVAQYPGGKLVVAGERFDPGGLFTNLEVDFAVARLESDGTLDDDNDGDGGFDGDGKLTTRFRDRAGALAVAIQPDGNIVVLGTSAQDSLLARYLPNGALDPSFGSFGTGGKLAIPGDELSSLALAPDGTLVLAGRHTSPDGDNKLAVRRLLPGGAPDMSFDGDGVAWFDFGGHDVANAVAVLPDGRILAGGLGNSNSVLLRLWPDGTLDTYGKQTHAVNADSMFPPGSDVTFATLTFQPNGHTILVAGEVTRQDQGRSGAFLTRFDANGLPDSNFGAQGVRLVTDGVRNGARAVLVQPGGKILIAGYSDWGNDVWPADFMVARYQLDGSPDIGFGGSGKYIRHLNFASGADVATALALAPDGKIVLAGWATSGHQTWGVVRLDPEGAPDSAFDRDGKLLIDFGPGSSAHAVLVQPDGKIVVGGRTSGDDFALARLLDDGQFDPSFGQNGVTITDMGGQDNIAALALGADGMIYAGGYSWRGGADDYALAQYTPEGQLATCPAGQPCPHWPDGKRYVNIGGSDSAFALDLRADGQLVAAGCTDSHLSAAQVSTTDASAAPLVFETSFAGHFNCAFGVQFTGSGSNRIIAAGPTYHDFNGNIALARFETTGETAPPTPTPPGPTPTATPPVPANTYRIYLPGVMRQP